MAEYTCWTCGRDIGMGDCPRCQAEHAKREQAEADRRLGAALRRIIDAGGMVYKSAKDRYVVENALGDVVARTDYIEALADALEEVTE